ncbi:aromatic acid exporter family protein [Streptomyces libani]
MARVRRWWGRALGSEGHERSTVLLIAKGTLAATIAWVISYHLLHAQSPAFAPFSAVLIMQVTVYQSLLQSSRYVGAVVAGVAVQAALGFLVGPDVPAFALVALVALTIGRWPALGSQGSQVATAAFFAFSTYVSATSTLDKVTQLGQIILLVLIGCGIGVLVNVTVLPPLRYRSAEHGIRTLAHALCDLVSDIYPALRERGLDEERTGRWRARAEQTGELVTQARTGLRMARESLHYNPRRLFRRGRAHTYFEGYAAVLEALERTLRQVAALTRSLDKSGVRTKTVTATAPFWRATPISWNPSPTSPASSLTSTRTGSATRHPSCTNWPTRHRTTADGWPNRRSGTTCRSRTPAAPMECWSSRPPV